MSPEQHPGANGTGNLEGELKNVVNADENGAAGSASDKPAEQQSPAQQPAEQKTGDTGTAGSAESKPSPYPTAQSTQGSAAVPQPSKAKPDPHPTSGSGPEQGVTPNTEPPAESKSAESKSAEHKPELASVAAGAGAAAATGAAASQNRESRHRTEGREPAVHAVGREPSAAPAKPRRSTGQQIGSAARRILKVIASVIGWIGVLAALILVLYVIFTYGHANPANYLTAFISDWAHRLNLGLGNLFMPKDPLIALILDYGIAAIIWLVVTRLIARLLQRF